MERVYLHEFNILMDRQVYLPNVSGMLAAYAASDPIVTNVFEFMPFLFVRSEPRLIVERWDNPAVLAFSCSIWNQELNLTLARIARERYPKALIVFGGPNVPTKSEEFIKTHTFVDVAVLGEGECTFTEVLKAFAGNRDYSRVHGIVYRDDSGCGVRTSCPSLPDINRLPSPYLMGLYEPYLADRKGLEYQVILETNRGCPFGCGFCYWGNGSNKVRMFDLARVKQEIDWIGDHHIPFVFGADANFGMIPRDKIIANHFADTKKRTGFPRAFRVCYGKNNTDQVFEVAKVLDTEGLTKGVTVSFQSTDPVALKNIGRSNIKLSVYRELLKKYRRDKLRVYTEFIIGLPGETYDSFSNGLEEAFQAGLYDQASLLLCQLLPNTEMDDPAFKAKHGLITRRIQTVEPYSFPRASGEVVEYETIVVGTNTMPIEDWKRSTALAWIAQVIHGLKLGFFVALYLFNRFGVKYTEFFEQILLGGEQPERFPLLASERRLFAQYTEGLLSGKPQCVVVPEYGDISWRVEESTFLRLSENFHAVLVECEMLTLELLEKKHISYSLSELVEVFRYQEIRLATAIPKSITEYVFKETIPEYFDLLLEDRLADIRLECQILCVQAVDYKGDRKKFAQEVVWFGRRNCKMIEPVTWT